MKISTLKKSIYITISIVILLMVWSIISYRFNQPLLFPSLFKIIKSFFKLFNFNDLSILGMTLLRVIISTVLVFIISIIIGFIYTINKASIIFLKPIITLMKSTPIVIISLFLFILIGKYTSPYVICFLITFPIMIESVITAIDNIDQSLKDDLRLINDNPFIAYLYAYLPLIKEYLLMSFLQIFGLGFKAMIMGEYICQTPLSIGRELYSIKTTLEMSELLAWAIMIVMVVAIFEIMMKKINNKIINTKLEAN